MNLRDASRALLLAMVAAAPLAGCASTEQTDGQLRSAANEALRHREYERVIAIDDELIRRQPGDFDATLQQAIAFDRLGRTNVAMAGYSKAIAANPSAVVPRLYRANLALKVGNTDLALDDMRNAEGLASSPSEKIAVATLSGTVFQVRKDYGSAVQQYLRAIATGRRASDLRSSKHYRDALHNAAQCFYYLGDFKSALQSMDEKVTAVKRAGARLTEDDYYMLGLLSYRTGDFDASRDHFANVSPARRRKAAEVLEDESFFELGS
ncbi:MAG: tetratricopeptide repeat protein [Planctomycetota bacterium]